MLVLPYPFIVHTLLTSKPDEDAFKFRLVTCSALKGEASPAFQAVGIVKGHLEELCVVDVEISIWP